MKSHFISMFFCLTCIYIVLNRDQINTESFYHYDKSGYYIYLPAVFIYKDLKNCDFHHQMAATYGIGGGGKYGMNAIPDGGWLNKYPIGVSIFELPGFVIAHCYAKVSSEHMPDGYSKPYKISLIFTTIFWSFIGMLVLRRFLLRHFTDTVTAIVIACIAFGTNVYCYAAFDQGMSHNISFFLFACLLLFTDRWFASGKRKDIYFLGVTLGLITITRPVNILVVLVPLLWGLYNKQTLVERINLLRSKYKDVLITFLCFSLVALIQLSYWKYITGEWLYFSYVGEEFNFKNPQIINGLFSFRKGWFVYTPIAFAGLSGLFFTPRKHLISYLTFFTVMIYVVFSWENWYYGGGFGARAMIETLPIVSFPLAFLTKAILYKSWVVLKAAYLAILGFLIFLNLFQTYQYSRRTIHYDRMTYTYYWRVFLKLHADDDDNQYLMDEEEFWDEQKRWHKN